MNTPTPSETVEQTTPETVEPTVEQTVDEPTDEVTNPLSEIDRILRENPEEVDPPADDETLPEVTEPDPSEGQEPGDGTPAEPADEAAAVVEEKPAAEAAAQQPTDTERDAAQDYDRRRAAFNAKLAKMRDENSDDAEYDPFTDGKEGKKLFLEYVALNEIEMETYRADARQRRQQDAATTAWSTFAKDHPLVGSKQGQQIWDALGAVVTKEYQSRNKSPQELHAILEDRFYSRVKLIEAQKNARGGAADTTPAPTTTPRKPAASKPAPKITPNGGRVTPASVPPARQVTRPLTPEEELDRKLMSNGGLNRLIPGRS